ncbi:hypothetical protein EV363DRAFT_1451773 [Boletus edulis]|nr:hypothetical protein EV363DRAFT_1451773 [Boletus edulis]
MSAFDWKSSNPWLGHVHLDVSTKSLVGVGTFKTAQIAHLMLSPLRPASLGSLLNQSIIIKWSYIVTGDKTAQSGPPFVYSSLEKEANQLYREANIMYWAKALLKLTYNYIYCAVDNADQALSFEIPHLCFIDASLLLAFTEHHNPNAAMQKTVEAFSAIYLAEELIVTTGGNKFMKFIHNGDFLSFMQHIQYVKTGGQGYLSDYQGCPPLLTNSQILTHLDVSRGKALFGDSNLKTGIELFEKQHYCHWPGFGLDVFGGSESNVESETGGGA